MLKMCRAIRSVKMCQTLAKVFTNVNELFYKTVLTFPSLMKMLNVITCLFYFYALLGCEIYKTDIPHEHIYEGSVMGDFNSFSMALLALF